MTTNNYALTDDESATLNATLAGSPYVPAAAHVTAATAALAGLTGDALTRAQARVDRLTDHRNNLVRSAYADVLTGRVPPVVLGTDWTIDRQTISDQDTLVVTTP